MTLAWNGFLSESGRKPAGQARAELDRATELFRELEMSWWLEQAEKLEAALETS